MKVVVFTFVVGLLLFGVLNARRHKCGRNMTPTNCAPCNPICGEGPRPCPLFCLVNATLCKCKSGFYLPTANSLFCVPKNRCPRKPKHVHSSPNCTSSSSG